MSSKLLFGIFFVVFLLGLWFVQGWYCGQLELRAAGGIDDIFCGAPRSVELPTD